MKTAMISFILASVFLVSSCATIPESDRNPGAVNVKRSGKQIYN